MNYPDKPQNMIIDYCTRASSGSKTATHLIGWNDLRKKTLNRFVRVTQTPTRPRCGRLFPKLFSSRVPRDAS